MKQVLKIYDKAFKEKAVQLSYERTIISELARELGVTAPQLYKWRKEFKNLEREVFLEKGI
ncbi:transposase [Flavobacterium sp. ZS1P70]|uniref:Transposase n=1 Tax=Flavobacterium zhoui TaxID=3230414 RepID=A0ABW6I397_9FLAO